MQCPCGKNRTFTQCCGKYLKGFASPKTAEQLMRSRYSAYALGGYGQYLFDTWHPMKSQGLDADQLSLKVYIWTGLEVISKSQKGDIAHVEFNAYYSNTKGENFCLHENSEFHRMTGKWLYVGAI